jgi:hypothetical protein
MSKVGSRGDRTTEWMRRIARASSVVIIAFTLVMIAGHLVVPDPHEVDYAPIKNLLPLMMSLSVLGLGIA